MYHTVLECHFSVRRASRLNLVYRLAPWMTAGELLEDLLTQFFTITPMAHALPSAGGLLGAV